MSSHSLAIETGRHEGLTVADRVCKHWLCLEDEQNFLFQCSILEEARRLFNARVCFKYIHYTNLNDDQKLVFLFSNCDPQLHSWLGKFIYYGLRQRQHYHDSSNLQVMNNHIDLNVA